jgi:hypothetical protein
MFNSTGPHYCPVCPPQMSSGKKYKPRRIDPPLVLEVSNYSGCGVDMAKCPTCERTFQISYKVDQILDVTEEVKKIRGG